MPRTEKEIIGIYAFTASVSLVGSILAYFTPVGAVIAGMGAMLALGNVIDHLRYKGRANAD